jgi:hypothetical protein
VAELRVLGVLKRPMQRLGYLKRLVRRVTTLNTSNLDNLGTDLIDAVTRKIAVPLNSDRAAYIKLRLQDRAYSSLKNEVAAWLKLEPDAPPPTLSMELQDLYLADPSLPSHVGKLVRDDWRRYPPLGITLGFIRAGTYSPNTRALSLLHFTPDGELEAFTEYKPEQNPLRISRSQALLLLYAFLENDGEILAPLWTTLAATGSPTFTDRDAGDCLPSIYRAVIARHRKSSLPVEQRERLEVLEKSAANIEARRDKAYTGGSAREEASAPRVEPFVDIGLFDKPDDFKYEYAFNTAGQVWAEALSTVVSSDNVLEFLTGRFFSTAAKAWNPDAQPLTDSQTIIGYLRRAWEVIHTSGGYAPIEEFALVAGIHALLDDGLVLEQASARETLRAYQKENPYKVRFTVNRLGVLAHARFLENGPSEG